MGIFHFGTLYENTPHLFFNVIWSLWLDCNSFWFLSPTTLYGCPLRCPLGLIVFQSVPLAHQCSFRLWLLKITLASVFFKHISEFSARVWFQMAEQNVQNSQWPSSWLQNNKIYVFMILWFAGEAGLMISAMKSRFHFSYNTFRRKTQELKNTSAELEIKEKKWAFSVQMPNSVSLFFLGNAKW